VAERRLGDRLVLIDQPAPEHLALYRSLLDVAIFTRIDTLKASMLSPYEVLAAMAAGRAVAAYATNDAVEVIEDGVSGLLCKPGDVADLTAKVHALLTDSGRRARLGAAAQQACWGASANVASQELSGFYARLLAPEASARVAAS
jgi:glycosyltransferase involved in cell wall biosynthesis